MTDIRAMMQDMASAIKAALSNEPARDWHEGYAAGKQAAFDNLVAVGWSPDEIVAIETGVRAPPVAAASLSNVEPGWKLVPMNPSEEMIAAAVHALDGWNLSKQTTRERARLKARMRWDAMLAVSPTAPAAEPIDLASIRYDSFIAGYSWSISDRDANLSDAKAMAANWSKLSNPTERSVTGVQPPVPAPSVALDAARWQVCLACVRQGQHGEWVIHEDDPHNADGTKFMFTKAIDAMVKHAAAQPGAPETECDVCGARPPEHVAWCPRLPAQGETGGGS